MPREIKNVAASVRQQLLNRARATNRPFNEVLQHFAMERFLYRLAKSPYAEKFVLKGALMMRVWNVPVSRPTMDIDSQAAGGVSLRRRLIGAKIIQPQVAADQLRQLRGRQQIKGLVQHRERHLMGQNAHPRAQFGQVDPGTAHDSGAPSARHSGCRN